MKNLSVILSALFLLLSIDVRSENKTSPEVARGGGGGGGGHGGGHGGEGRGEAGRGGHGDPNHYDREDYEEGNSEYFYDAEDYPAYDDEGNMFWETEESGGGEHEGEHHEEHGGRGGRH